MWVWNELMPASSAARALGSLYRSGRSRQWLKAKNPAAPTVRREAEEVWR
jgi:hypothetical protein